MIFIASINFNNILPIEKWGRQFQTATKTIISKPALISVSRCAKEKVTQFFSKNHSQIQLHKNGLLTNNKM